MTANYGLVADVNLAGGLALRPRNPSSQTSALGEIHQHHVRVFRLLDPAQFHACFLRFMEDFAATAQGVIAIDGKALLVGGDILLSVMGMRIGDSSYEEIQERLTALPAGSLVRLTVLRDGQPVELTAPR